MSSSVFRAFAIFTICLLACSVLSTGASLSANRVYNSEARRMLGQFTDIEFKNTCVNTTFSIALGTYAKEAQFKSSGWLNLHPSESKVVKLETEGSKEFSLYVNVPSDGEECLLGDSDFKWDEKMTSSFCINGENGFEIIATLDKEGAVNDYIDQLSIDSNTGNPVSSKTCEGLGKCYQNKLFFRLKEEDVAHFLLQCIKDP